MSKQQIRVALAQCDPDEALQPDDKRLEDFDYERKVKVQEKLIKCLESAGSNPMRPGYAHIPLVGHLGSGKSTELNRFIAEAETKKYLVITSSVILDSDPDEIIYSDVIRLLTEKLVSAFKERATLRSLSPDRIQNVYRWYQEITQINEKELETGYQLGGEAGLGGEIKAKASVGVSGTGGEIEGGLGKLLALIGLQRKAFTKKREEIKEKLEQYPQSLLDNLNLLLDDAQRSAREGGYLGIVFVLDDTDKYSPEMLDKVFIRNHQLFKSLNAHLVFTMNISMLYRPIEDTLEGRYPLTQNLPMIPVFKRMPREADQLVIDRLVDAIYKRVPRELFENETLPRRIACVSGGCPRDLLRILGRALLEADDVITAQNVSRAIALVRTEVSRPVTLERFDILAKTHLDGTIDPNDTTRNMLRLRQILEYNGEGWKDAHPLLQLTSEFRQALAKELAKRNLPSMQTPLCA